MDKVIVFRKRLLPYSETFIAEQGCGLKDHQVLFAGFEKDDNGFDLLQGQDVSLLKNHSASLGFDKVKMKLGCTPNSKWMKSLQESNGRLIHAHFGSDGIAASLLAKKLSVPLLCTFHGSDITVNNSSNRYVKQRNSLFDSASKIVAVSSFIQKKLIEKGCPEKKIIHLPIGKDLSLFSGDESKTDNPSIVFIGRFTENKGLKYLLQAVKIIHKQLPDIQIDIIGEGKTKLDFQNYCLNEKLPVKFLGRLTPDQVKMYLGRAWLLCVPSVRVASGAEEGLGMVFLEAQAMKTPVVSFETGGIPEAVMHGKTGFLAKSRDVHQLSDYMLNLLKDEKLRNQFGLDGRLYVESEFDIKKQCKKLEDVYRSII